MLYPLDRALRLNQMQVMGTHNAYKTGLIPEGLPPSLAENLGGEVAIEEITAGLDYGHKSLTEQLSRLGVRQLALDVYADPQGGNFTEKPMLAEVGAPTRMVDPEWNEPGLKVFHVPQVDQQTSCVRFTSCLDELQQWSTENPGHLPITIFVEIKDTDALRTYQHPPMPQWGPADYDELDAEIRSVFPDDKIITPDDVKGDYPTLEAAVLDQQWPTLAESRGKFMFVNCNCLVGDRHRLDYIRPDGSLSGRVLFPASKPGNPDAAVVLAEDPIKDAGRIRQLVEAGYLVRTRADANTVEARRNDTTPREAAFASGAQFINTDYPEPDPRLKNDYAVQIPGGTPARCNPVNAPASCKSQDIENPAFLRIPPG
ncbi:Ca2+-dependent phosphoinositide-specific phospholipase C [Nocardia australiensis]|uniref:Ca2+-dependent phosphoinositide-specific phospholipase C n=1 Tax=Nocardia australiensis TaxID=2887191 RepID=UPI001D1543F1|nr:Ca2+-dependent phosphoinositide-specific phospholipase C [Nocardia australiensis]